jgi:hypothetical protein
MADAPAPSGNKLAGVEILLLVVLGIGAFAVLSGNPLKPVATNPAPAPVTTPRCGIVLSRPIKNERISNIVTLSGTITPCDNSPLLSTILTVQVVDRSGAPMSDLTRITMAAATNDSASFSGALPITGNPLPGTGYLIVTGPVRPDGTSLSARTPITF